MRFTYTSDSHGPVHVFVDRRPVRGRLLYFDLMFDCTVPMHVARFAAMFCHKKLLNIGEWSGFGRSRAHVQFPKLLALASLFAFVLLLDGTYSARAATLVPHTAQYRLSLEQLKIPGEAAAAGGDLAIRIERTCKKWRIISHFQFNIDFRDSDRRMHVEVAQGSEEDLNGQTLLFESHTTVNGENVLSLKGTADLTEAGDNRAILTKPERAVLTLPKGTLLPMFAARRTLDALERGVRFDSYLLFDGSNPTGPYRVSDVVGGKPLSLKRPPTGDTVLLDTQSWRVSSSFFDHKSVDVEPQSTTVIQIHSNGIVSRVLLDIGFLVAEGELVEIKSLPTPNC